MINSLLCNVKNSNIHVVSSVTACVMVFGERQTEYKGPSGTTRILHDRTTIVYTHFRFPS